MADRSFRVPSFYKPSRTFADLSWAFLDRGDLFNTGLQVLYNHEYALPWEDIDVNVKDEDIWDCVVAKNSDIAYQRGQVPRVPGKLVVGADWGEKETHWVVALIDREENIWVVDWGTVDGLEALIREKANGDIDVPRIRRRVSRLFLVSSIRERTRLRFTRPVSVRDFSYRRKDRMPIRAAGTAVPWIIIQGSSFMFS